MTNPDKPSHEKERTSPQEHAGSIGNIATRSVEHADRLGEIKEILHGQKIEAMSGYSKFLGNLGEAQLGEEDYDKALGYYMKKWEADNSLVYLQIWLIQNPGHEVYLSASPNKIIARDKLRDAGSGFVLGNTDTPEGTQLNWDDVFSYSDEEIWGEPEQGDDEDDLPMRLSVWTDSRNLDDAPIMEQIQRIKEMQKVVGSASDQTIPQTLGHWYRLRENERFRGGRKEYQKPGSLVAGMEESEGRQLLIGPKQRSDGARYVPSAFMGYAGSEDGFIGTFCLDDFEDEAVDARFIIS